MAAEVATGGCYRVGLGITPSLWAAQASPSLLGGVVGVATRQEWVMPPLGSRLPLSVHLPGPVRNYSRDAVSRETVASLAAGSPARGARGRPSSPPLPRPLAPAVGAAAPRLPSLLRAPYRLRVSPGRRSQARLRSAETAAPQRLHDPHQCQREASEAPPLSIPLGGRVCKHTPASQHCSGPPTTTPPLVDCHSLR